MKFSIIQKEPKKDQLIIADNINGLKQAALTKEETTYIQKAHKDKHALITLNRYDKEPAPAQEGDAIAARLITIALQQAVSSGTGRQLMNDGLGRLSPAGKTGTSNDGRDSWFAGWTGDHLAVIWVGNDQNKTTGLYGATGAMRVWSSLFARLPTAPLEVGDKGLDWQWVIDSNTTDAGCAGARRFAFVAGFAPPYAPCPAPQPALPFGQRQGIGGGQNRVCRVKGSIKTGVLRQIGGKAAKRPDAHQVRRIVQRGQRCTSLYARLNRCGDPARRGQLCPAMHNPMPRRPQIV